MITASGFTPLSISHSAHAAPAVSVVVPTLNEAGNIGRLLEEVFAACGSGPAIEVVVVDDGSTDGTREKVLAWSETHPVRLVARDHERGLAGAVLAGAEAAVGGAIVVMDADLSHPPACIPDLARPVLEGTRDMVIGSRYVPGGATPGWPLKRRITSRVAGALSWPLVDVRDPLAGFFAIRRENLLKLDRGVKGLKIGLEAMVKGGDDLRVSETPITFVDRTSGASKMSTKQITAYLKQLPALAGGSVSGGNAGRFAVVGLIGLAVDRLTFQMLWLTGLSLAAAHLLSFLAATAANYALNSRWAFAAGPCTHRLGSAGYAKFLTVCLLALFMRGGVLGMAVGAWHWPPMAGLVVALLAAAVVNYVGCAFFVFPLPTPHLGATMRWRIAAVGVAAYAFLLRLVYLGSLDLLPEEAYYWNYAQHPALSYLDHPPMVAWLIRLGTAVFGDTEFGVRIGGFLCAIVAAGFGYGLTRNMFDKSTAMRALLLMAVLPFFFIFGLFSTPDAPLIACWAAALFFLERALLGERRTAWWGVGVCLGLGMLSKYTIALLGPATLAYLVLDRSSRRWLRRPEPYLAVLLAVLLFCPVIVWNAWHGWASFAFQSVGRMDDNAQFSLHTLLLAMALLLTPVGLIAVVKALLPHWLGGPDLGNHPTAIRRRWFTLAFTLAPLAVFVLFSLRHSPKLNWTGPLWLAVIPMLAWELVPSRGVIANAAEQFGRRLWAPTVVVTLILFGGFLHYLALGLPGVVGYDHNMTLPVAWEEMGRLVEDLEHTTEEMTGQEPLVVGMDKYYIASQMAFYRRDALNPQEGVVNTTSNLFYGNGLMYEYWFPSREQNGRTLILVSFDAKALEYKVVAARVRSLGPIQEQSITKNGRTVGHFFYRLAYGYHAGQDKERPMGHPCPAIGRRLCQRAGL